MRRVVALVAVMSGVALAEELHVQCPAGTGAVLRGNTVVCEPLPQHNRPVQVMPQPAPPPSTNEHRGLEHSGLHAIPDICGLAGVNEHVVENTAEAVHIAVGECADELGTRPSPTPTRWLVFRVTALSEKTHEIVPPPESWGGAVGDCLIRKPARFPKQVRGKSFTAWFLMAPKGATPWSPACVERK